MMDIATMRGVLAKIKKNPAGLEQGNWMTRTPQGVAYCFAGWVLVTTGIPMSPLSGSVLMEDVPAAFVPEIVRRLHRGARLAPAGVVAAVVLGLTRDQAAQLFSPRNTIARLEEVVNRFAAQA